jgi:hypothetical protein
MKTAHGMKGVGMRRCFPTPTHRKGCGVLDDIVGKDTPKVPVCGVADRTTTFHMLQKSVEFFLERSHFLIIKFKFHNDSFIFTVVGGNPIINTTIQIFKGKIDLIIKHLHGFTYFYFLMKNKITIHQHVV